MNLHLKMHHFVFKGLEDNQTTVCSKLDGSALCVTQSFSLIHLVVLWFVLCSTFSKTLLQVSGDRMWALLKELSGSPDVLFSHVFLHNYCPLFYLKDSAKNVTPPELKVIVDSSN